MIFATVGTQLPFDRLLNGLDRWAASRPERAVQAQTGNSGARFRHLICTPFMAQACFREAIETAEIIVGHAGRGTILTAAELGKPCIIMPRLAAHGEHRNDHQLATAAEMCRLPNVSVVDDAEELAAPLDDLINADDLFNGAGIDPFASPQLITAVAGFIRGAA